MKNKLRTGLIICIPLVFALAGCSLDAKLTNSYPEDTPWNNETNLELYLNKFYPLIGQTYYNEHVENDACSDILRMNSPTASQNLFAYGSVIITPAQNIFNNWNWGHQWVLDINRFLDGLATNGSNFSEETRLRAEAEARWFRAYVYFAMARRYGASVVLYKELPVLGEKDHARCEPDQCWDFIEDDLDFAAEYLPSEVAAASRGKLTKGAAYGLKSRAMLYAKRWKAASDAVEDLMDLGLYDLEPDYEDLFLRRRATDASNKESILEFGYSAPDFGYSFDKFYAPPGDQGYAQASPTEELVSMYQMADGTDFDWNEPAHAADPYTGREDRFYASILYNGAQWKGRTIQAYEGGIDGIDGGGSTTSTGYYMRKLLDPNLGTGFQNTDLTFYFIRYAEVLLNYAEAMAEQNDLTTALWALNEVRGRAGFPDELSTTSKQQFMEWLRRERAVELAFEGHRFWDLRRWGLATSVLNDTNLTGTKPIVDASGTVTSYVQIDADYGRKRKYQQKYDRFPIPSTEMQRNALMEQFDEWK